MSGRALRRWAPAAILVLGVLLLSFVHAQLAPQLRQPLDQALPDSVAGMNGEDVALTQAEADVAGFADYALRVYETGDSAAPREAGLGWVSVYLGYYDQQSRGRTIHSPKNCLPGSGWEALSSEPTTIAAEGQSFTVNRYILQNGDERALVLYWYQGRGRVAHDEYLVKWDLLRDAALRRRTDEALVRIVVSLGSASEEQAFAVASRLAVEPRYRLRFRG